MAAAETTGRGGATAEDRYRVLFEENPMPMWAYDKETLRIVAANAAAAEQYGYSQAELLSRSLVDMRPAGDVERFLRDHEQHPAERRRAGVWKHRRKDGTLIDVDVHVSEIELDGRVLRLAVLHDVTARRRLEEQLHLAQRMETVARLAGGVAHDFNNLLTIVCGHAELLQLTLPEGARERDSVREILEAGQRAGALTRQLLAFSRKQVLEPRILDLNTTVAAVEKILRRLIGEDVELVARLAPDLERVIADPGQIEQILINLAVNARDAMPAGGRLEIASFNVEVGDEPPPSSPPLRAGVYAALAVVDSGVGMDEPTRARIFEPFFTTKPHGKGTGLGLSTVYGIVEQSGGAIEVRSQPDRGTTFVIYLPRGVDPRREAPAVPVAVAGDARRPAVLLIEDDLAVRRLTAEILVRAGYEVIAAAEPEQALEEARRRVGTIDLVLTDVVMPGMTGPELMAQVRTFRPGIRTLYMSGYTAEAPGAGFVLEPGAPLLAKPFARDKLLTKVREVLGA